MKEHIIIGLDHLVITVKDIKASTGWYAALPGMNIVKNGSRYEAHFGSQKINFHAFPGEFQPAAAKPTEGSADLCFEMKGSIEKMKDYLQGKNIPIVEGPVPRTGARGPMTSLYLRDPDGNLIEISLY